MSLASIADEPHIGAMPTGPVDDSLAGPLNAECRALEEVAGVRLLEELAVLSVLGDDARAWINGQVTNDVRALRKGESVYTLATNVRGKILCDLLVVDRGDTLALVAPRAALPALMASFDKHIIMEDVEVAEVMDTEVISVQGPRAPALTAEIDGAFPSNRVGVGGMDILVTREAREEVLRLLVERGATEVSDAAWELVRLRRALPRYGRDFGERNYPQEAGLKARAVSFQKGCYLGQEVICTLENRGQLVRKLVRLEGEGDLSLDAGAKIQSAGAEIGELTSAAFDAAAPKPRTLALGYIKRAHAQLGAALAVGAHTLVVTEIVGEA